MHTVLVVEDDPTVLMFLEDGLEEQGFAVVSARSSGEALNILGAGMYPIDVLVADIRLGDGIDGWEIARCARESVPGLPIVYITGDSILSFAGEGVADSVILQKPFSRLELSDAIRSLL
ncbi:response regulator [Sphingomonas sp. A2-49]|uniref:response regulator n=1 Tax=Sphingomonas sp. A2-49 TaxID=1391375 RepID=UPI0021D3B337|nr:response regulator [Sphingomonas sp. A2-49]MCU6454086.1 response regulator [Sphingomonas sp. A2-49]